MIRLHRLHRVLAIALVAAAVSACDISGVGSGNRPEKLEIFRSSNPDAVLIDLGGDVEQHFLCFPEQLQSVVTFSDGSFDASALLNTRVRWTSSDPSVIEVSNDPSTGGEVVLIPDSEDQAFAAGVLVPRRVGTATVTAEFVGLTSESYQISVREIDELELNKSSVKVAPETGDRLTLTAAIDGYSIDVTTSALWAFDVDEGEEDEIDDIATIGVSTGFVRGVGLGGPLVARAEFPLCSEDPRFSDITAEVVVEPLAGLQVAREFVDAPNSELIVGTTEKLTMTGRFADATTIDLSGQVRVESTEDEVIVANPVTPQFLTALKAGTTQIQAVYGGDDDNDEDGDTDPPEVRSNSVTLNAVEGELQDFAIAPLNQTVVARGSQQFEAIGTFSVAGATRTQSITRGVLWSVSDLDDEPTGIVSISNSSLNAGQAFSRSVDAGAVKISGRRNIGDDDDDDDNNTVTRETVLCIAKPNTPAAPCPPPDEEDASTP